MFRNPLLQFLFLILGAWMLLQLIGRTFGLVGMAVVVLVSGVAALSIYMLRYDRRGLAAAYRRPVLRQGIDLLCKLLKEQPPIEAELPADSDNTTLKEPGDFDWAAQKLKERVFGHDAVVECLIYHLKNSALLRQRSQGQAANHPVAAFLLIGPEGIGKRHLAVQMGRLLYRKGALTTVNMADYTDDAVASVAMFGGGGQEGQLLQSVKARPYHTVLIENIEAAGPQVQTKLESLFQTGTFQTSGGGVSFRHCVFFLLSARKLPEYSPDKMAGIPATERPRRLLELVSGETGLNRKFLTLLHEIVLMDMPEPLDQARVIVRLMQEECQNYRVTLDFVEPEIIVEEVADYDIALGFAPVRGRITKRLRELLAVATANKLEHLVLTIESYLQQV